jgi:hypothetical protein
MEMQLSMSFFLSLKKIIFDSYYHWPTSHKNLCTRFFILWMGFKINGDNKKIQNLYIPFNTFGRVVFN